MLVMLGSVIIMTSKFCTESSLRMLSCTSLLLATFSWSISIVSLILGGRGCLVGVPACRDQIESFPSVD